MRIKAIYSAFIPPSFFNTTPSSSSWLEQIIGCLPAVNNLHNGLIVWPSVGVLRVVCGYIS